MRMRQTVNRRTRRVSFWITSIVGVGVCLASASRPAFGQDPTMPHVKPGQTVWVTAADGTMTKGKVQTVGTTGVQLTSGAGRTSLPLSSIERIETRDSLKNGAIIGAIPTAVLLGVGAGVVSGLDCLFKTVCEDSANKHALIGAVAGAGIGALIGAAIDRAIPGRRVLYRAAGRAARVTVTPAASPGHAGLRMTLAW